MRACSPLYALALCIGLWLCGQPDRARADQDVVVYARVVVERAALRTGPGATFRLVRTAEQGETFPVRERAPRGYWLRVELPDGSTAYVQGDAVFTHEVGARSRGERVLGKLFAPPPLLAAHGEVSISLGALSSSGFMAARASWLLAPAFGFEATLGAAVGSTGRIFLGSVGGIVNLFPSWPVVPFVEAGVWRWSTDIEADVTLSGTPPVAASTTRSLNGWSPIVAGGVEFWPARYVGVHAGIRWVRVEEELSDLNGLLDVDDQFRLVFVGIKFGVR